ncbi:hypothetical protein SLOPH_1871 [Spraguea lophii 42_110]|uniref:Uncharacterized protein n=1 Tax=Spraguea lophii (strain 42_110) TaxID=1358809 RepID=S7XFF3_SPRLO|nr:hypothetical protein SLOPH_1871 [Spraguea lophii 42_110]
MNALTRIDKVRRKYNINDNNYKNICKSNRKGIYSLEYLLYLLRTNKTKIRKIEKVKAEGLYEEYRQFIIKYYKKDDEYILNNGTILLEKLIEYPSFYEEVEDILTSKYEKINKEIPTTTYEWKGIKLELKFYQIQNIQHLKNFNSKVINQIEEIKKQENKLQIQIEKQHLKSSFEKSKKLEQTLTNFIIFLKENYLPHKEIDKLRIQISFIKNYLKNIIEYENGNIELEEEIKNAEKNNKIEERYKNIRVLGENKKINENIAKKIILEYIEKEMKPKERINIPLEPITYDLAYDYINYPEQKKDLMSMIKRLNIFSKK